MTRPTVILGSTLLFSCVAMASVAVYAQPGAEDRSEFEKLLNNPWKKVFFDSGTGNWKKKWFLDGLKGKVMNTAEGMEFMAGPVYRENASHAVLWTKKSFEGEIKIEYEYTKTDDHIHSVNILYLLATGSGVEGYDKDILKWQNGRDTAYMRMYFNHMNLYHISYAAWHVKNDDPEDDYIRARRYIPETDKNLEGTDFKPEYQRTGLFKKGVPHKITVIKKGNKLFFYVKNDEKEMLCAWDVSSLPPVTHGRIGLRQMWQRSARYRNFKVSELVK